VPQSSNRQAQPPLVSSNCRGSDSEFLIGHFKPMVGIPRLATNCYSGQAIPWIGGQMVNRRGVIHLAMAVLGAAAMPSVARSQQSFQRFVPLLVELPGWKGNKPDGMGMEMAGTSMITATRTYE